MSFYVYQLIAMLPLAGYVSFCRKSRMCVLPFAAVFAVFFIPAAIRYGIGTDYFYTYVPGLDIVAVTGENAQWELAFLAICKAVLHFDLPNQWLFGIASFLTCLFALISFPRKGFVWCVLGFVVAMYLHSYNAVRQELAIAVSLFAFSLHLRRKDLLAVLVLAAATLFHSSVIILLPMVAAVAIVRKWTTRTLFCGCSALAAFILLCHPMDVFMRLISFVPFAESYLAYENSDVYMGSGVANSGLGFLLWYFIWFVQGAFLLLRCKSRQGREIGVWCLMALLTKMIGSQVNIFARVSLATDAILPFSLALTARHARSLVEKIGFSIVVLLIIVSFMHDYGFNSNTHGPDEVLPYRTIFDEQGEY